MLRELIPGHANLSEHMKHDVERNVRAERDTDGVRASGVELTHDPILDHVYPADVGARLEVGHKNLSDSSPEARDSRDEQIVSQGTRRALTGEVSLSDLGFTIGNPYRDIEAPTSYLEEDDRSRRRRINALDSRWNRIGLCHLSPRLGPRGEH